MKNDDNRILVDSTAAQCAEGQPLQSNIAYQPVAKQKTLNPWLSQNVQLASVLASYLVAWLYVSMLFENMPAWLHPWSYPLFTAAFLGWGEAVYTLREGAGAPRPEKAVQIESVFWAICALAASFALALGLGEASNGWIILFWHGFAAYWVICRGGLLKEKRTGPFFAWDVLNAIVIVPFGGFFLRIRTLWRALTDKKREHDPQRAKTMWVTILCVVIALPFFVYAVNLLVEADRGFSEFLHGFQFSLELSGAVANQITILLLSIPVGAYLYGLIGVSTSRAPETDELAPARKEIERLRCVPSLADTLILIAFCILYLLFFLVQAGYLFGAFAGHLPAGFTVAEYARQGFYQLCWILVLNFGILTVCAKASAFPVRSLPVVRILCIVLMVGSMLFCATAFSKLVLYISCFGFTPRRLLSGWAMLVYAAGSVLAASSLLHPHAAIRKFVWFAAASFVVLCYIP